MTGKIITLAFMLGCLTAGAITLDGKLDEPEWQQAKKYTGFSRFAADTKGQTVSAQTEFSFVCTKDKIYVGIKCHEPEMEKLRTATPVGIWYTDGVELFLSPAGTGSSPIRMRRNGTPPCIPVRISGRSRSNCRFRRSI